MWLFLFLLQSPACPGSSSRRLISLLCLQPLQQALQWETLTEMETSLDFVTGLSYSWSSEHSTRWSDETRSSDTVSAHVATRYQERSPASQRYGCQYTCLKSTIGLKPTEICAVMWASCIKVRDFPQMTRCMLETVQHSAEIVWSIYWSSNTKSYIRHVKTMWSLTTLSDVEGHLKLISASGLGGGVKFPAIRFLPLFFQNCKCYGHALLRHCPGLRALFTAI